MAATLGGEQWWGGFGGRGRGEAARVGGGALKGEGRRRGKPGRRDGGAGGGAAGGCAGKGAAA
jgi:hypothetical protein